MALFAAEVVRNRAAMSTLQARRAALQHLGRTLAPPAALAVALADVFSTYAQLFEFRATVIAQTAAYAGDARTDARARARALCVRRSPQRRTHRAQRLAPRWASAIARPSRCC